MRTIPSECGKMLVYRNIEYSINEYFALEDLLKTKAPPTWL